MLILIATGTAESSFVDGLGVGARAMSMGSAYTAVADDLMAIYYNPAGLTQLKDHQILVGYIWSDPSVSESSPSDPGFHAEQVVPYHLKMPEIAIGFNLDRIFKGKIPVHTRVGVITMIPDNFKTIYQYWDPEPATPRWVRMGDYWDRVHVIGGFAFQLDKIPWVSLGIGFDTLVAGKMLFLPRHGTSGMDIFIRGPLPNVYAEGNVDFYVDPDISLIMGVMIQPTAHLRLGYSFHDSLSMVACPAQLVAEIHLGDSLAIPLSLLTNFEGYYWPQQHNFGVSYRWGEDLLISLGLTWYRWSRFTSESRGPPDPKWKDILVPRLGIEYRVLSAFAIRCGYFFEPSPVPNQTRVSNYIDNDRHAFSLGLGYSFRIPYRFFPNSMDLDVVFQYIHMPTRTTKKDQGFVPDFEARGEIVTVGGNLTFHF